MLNNEWPISNIFHRLRTKVNSSKNICLSNSNNTVFDAILFEHPEIVVLYKETLAEQNKVYDFNYDYMLFNSLMIESSTLLELKNSNIHIVIFNHEDLTKIKREDLHILNNNLKHDYITIINFNRNSDSVLKKSYNIEYGIPYTTNAKKEKNILIINHSNNSVLNQLFEEIKKTDKDSDMINSTSGDIEDTINQISKYKVVIDLESKINLILCTLCRGVGITSLDLTDSPINNHILKFGSFQNAFECVNYAMNKDPTDISDLSEIYNIETFNDNLTKILQGANNALN